MIDNVGIGRHLIIDFFGAKYLTDVAKIKYALQSASEAASAVVLETKVHQFPSSLGVTGVAVLAESHISVHTWPEYDYIALDIFMCGSADPQLAADWLAQYFEPDSVEIRTFERGLKPPQKPTP